jgi:hypothetical protein
MDSTTKQVQISASAMKGGKRGTRRKKKQQVEEEPTKKQKQSRILQVTKEGGGGVAQQYLNGGVAQQYVIGQNINSSCGVPGYQAPTQGSSASPLAEAFLKPVPQATLDQPIPVAGAPLPLGGSGQVSPQIGGKTIKLHKKEDKAKVKLHSKKVEVKKHLTKKNRKIILGLVSLKKRQTKASKIKQSVKEMPLEDLKKHLVTKGLIKVGSKAPESILRQIAADSQIVGSGSC